MKIIKDERKWKIYPILDKEECPYLYYPRNIHGCKYDDPKGYQDKECNYDICPIKCEYT